MDQDPEGRPLLFSRPHQGLIGPGRVGDGGEGQAGGPAEIACLRQGGFLAQNKPCLLAQDARPAAGWPASTLSRRCAGVFPVGIRPTLCPRPGCLPNLVGTLVHLFRREEHHAADSHRAHGIQGRGNLPVAEA